MNETLFFVFGIGLILAAVVVAFLGLRFESFPASKPVMLAATGLFAALVVATASFGWLSAEDEQEHRETELAEAAEENLAEGEEAEAAEEVGSEVADETETAAAADGADVFASAGCTGCHTLADAGSTAETGPNLDGALADQDAAYIEESIVNPAAKVAEGYPPNVMPENYETELSPEELDALVKYLDEVAGAKS